MPNDIEKKIEDVGQIIQQLEDELRPLISDVAPCRLWLTSYSAESKQQIQKQIDVAIEKFPKLIGDLDDILGIVMQCIGD